MRLSAVCTFCLLLTCLLFQPKGLSSQSWNQYPYQPDSSLLTFPKDEGRHEAEPVEWWYTNAHLTGDSTGTNYSVMLTYFDYPYLIFDGFRIFNLANDDAGTFYPETEAVTYNQLADSGLFINATTMSGHQESWTTKLGFSGNFVPFVYTLNATSANGSVSLNYITQKRPLIVADAGYLNQGKNNYTYYYSQTHLNVTGTITMDGTTEPVTGTAWIDRQFGNFNPNEDEKYEWFSVQLDNGMDLNLWNIFTEQNQIPDNLKYRVCAAYINDSTQLTTADIQMERLGYAPTADEARVYAQKWRVTSDTLDLDIIIEALYPDHEVSLPFRFYEGATTVSGTVDGQTVEGKGFAELLHSYEDPAIQIKQPAQSIPAHDTVDITWSLQNPDDGRPVWYDLWVKTNGSSNYQPIAANLTDTSYKWYASIQDSALALKVVGHSVDSTLAGSDEVNLVTSGQPTLSKFDTELKIHPNPTTGKVLINLPMEPLGGSVLQIYNESGKLMRQEPVQGNKHVVDLSALPDGMYIFKIGGDGYAFQGKVTKGSR